MGAPFWNYRRRFEVFLLFLLVLAAASTYTT